MRPGLTPPLKLLAEAALFAADARNMRSTLLALPSLVSMIVFVALSTAGCRKLANLLAALPNGGGFVTVSTSAARVTAALVVRIGEVTEEPSSSCGQPMRRV